MAKDVNGAGLIEKMKTYVPKGASVLEIGSGPGADFELLQQAYQVTGSDYSHEFLHRLKQRFKGGDFLHLDAVTLETENTYGALYSNKVLQHLTDDELQKSINKQGCILDSDGIICHSFWWGEGQEFFNGMLVNYQNENSLNALFSASFNLMVLERYTEFEPNDSILLIGKKI